jgi:hypothetical protein
MATSARVREENEELAPMTAWGCDNLRSAVKLCRTDHPSQAASPRVTNSVTASSAPKDSTSRIFLIDR